PSAFNTILIMDASCHNSSLPFPINLIRSVGVEGTTPFLGLSRDIKTVEELKKAIDDELKLGELVCKTQTYLSMSAEAHNNYFLGKPDRLVLMNVRVPAETPLYVSYHLAEAEIIFPRLARAKVISTGTVRVKNKKNPDEMLTVLTLDMEMK
ncbi:MAG: hypothetical protein HUK08_09955, partial [Bacteroidaceae bacterium]|nr:hypothetical protein [Bacteroidaceae bacterium]